MSQADGLAKAVSGLRLFACMLDDPGPSPTAEERDAVRKQGCGCSLLILPCLLGL